MIESCSNSVDTVFTFWYGLAQVRTVFLLVQFLCLYSFFVGILCYGLVQGGTVW